MNMDRRDISKCMYGQIKAQNRIMEDAMEKILIKDTTKQERIALIKSWEPEDEALDDNTIDLWEMYRDYIDGKREISEINASFNTNYFVED